jgi:lipid-binding SYLF domain-containing protein
MKTLRNVLMLLCGCAVVGVWGCSTAPKTPEARDVLDAEVKETIAAFQKKDPDIDRFFKSSYGYVVFPRVQKAALIAGGAYGKGEVFENNKFIGYSDLTQATVGFSIGGAFFREIVFFETQKDFKQFIMGEYVFAAQAMGVAATTGAAVKAKYDEGKVVFVMAESGLMGDVSIGGQKFNYTPKSIVEK